MDWNAIISTYSPVIIRILIILFSTLGVVYAAGRLLVPSLKDRGKNIIAFIFLIIISFMITLVYDYDAMVMSNSTRYDIIKYITDSSIYTLVGTVFYIIIGWRFYSRMDDLLDRKVGKDNRKRQ